MTARKSALLGMNFGTARARLDRDLLFKLAVDSGHVCIRCQQPLRREDFSLDHKKPWINSDDPKKEFFDLANVGFAHMRCNQMEGTERRRIYSSVSERRAAEKPRKAEWYQENKHWYNPARYNRRNKSVS